MGVVRKRKARVITRFLIDEGKIIAFSGYGKEFKTGHVDLLIFIRENPCYPWLKQIFFPLFSSKNVRVFVCEI